MKAITIIITLLIMTLTSCSLEGLQPEKGFVNNSFINYKGSGMMHYGSTGYTSVRISQIGFRGNNTGWATVIAYGKEIDGEFDWEYDSKRKWIKVTFLDAEDSRYFSYNTGLLKRENTTDDKDRWININETVIKNFIPEKSMAIGQIKNKSINLRRGPSTSFYGTRYSDSDEHNWYVIGKEGDWYKIALENKTDGINYGLTNWVHKDYFIVTKKGKV